MHVERAQPISFGVLVAWFSKTWATDFEFERLRLQPETFSFSSYGDIEISFNFRSLVALVRH